MRRICTTIGLIGVLLAALLALPGGASASHLARADFKSTSKYCKALRAELGAKAFKRAFRAKRVRGAHRRCVKKKGTVRALAPVSIFPVPAEACTPAEPPFPVRAFAADLCAPAPPVPVVPDGEEEDDDGEEEDEQDSDDGDDRDGDDGDSDDGDSDDDD